MLNQRGIEKVQKSCKALEDRLAFLFQALADQTRLRMFQLLANHKDLCVTDMAKVLKISVPAASYQLKLMEVVGLVKKERMGKMTCYALKRDDSLVKNIAKIIL